jgi:hypothetical protein
MFCDFTVPCNHPSRSGNTLTLPSASRRSSSPVIGCWSSSHSLAGRVMRGLSLHSGWAAAHQPASVSATNVANGLQRITA